MIRKILSAIAILFSSMNLMHAAGVDQCSLPTYEFDEEDEEDEKITAFYLISCERDFIGRGRAMVISEEDGPFNVRAQKDGRTVSINLGRYQECWEGKGTWSLDFAAPRNQILKKGIYKSAARFPIYDDIPGLSVTSCSRGCNQVGGEFEILEIEYDDAGTLQAFAVNFIQRCEVTGAPLFGSIRYRSSIPIEARFDEILDQDNKFVFYINRNDHDYRHACCSRLHEDPTLITAEDGECTFHPLPYGGEGIEVHINIKDQGMWILDFAAPTGGKFVVGDYDYACRYPFNSSDFPGIEILMPEGGVTQPEGEFQVLKLVKGRNGEIKSLAINFEVENDDGTTLSGAIRYNSKIEINLFRPFSSFNSGRITLSL